MPANTPKHSSATDIAERLYSAFQKLDGEAMAACYHPQAYFKDEAFELEGAQIGKMWQMLCANAREFSMTFQVTPVDDQRVRVHWEPKYHFSKTGRSVHNIIDAEIEIRDGLIYRHRDVFNFWRWSRQALGLPGYLLGWSGWLQTQVSTQAMAQLKRWKP